MPAMPRPKKSMKIATAIMKTKALKAEPKPERRTKGENSMERDVRKLIKR